MKKILFLFSIVIVLSFAACDDECINCQPASFCGSLDELAEKAAISECLAEDFIKGFGCPNMFCASNDPDISAGDLSTCTVIDCQTLSCEGLRLSTFFPVESMLITETVSGLIADISVDEISGLPTGTFIVDDLEGDFSCFVAIP